MRINLNENPNEYYSLPEFSKVKLLTIIGRSKSDIYTLFFISLSIGILTCSFLMLGLSTTLSYGVILFPLMTFIIFKWLYKHLHQRERIELTFDKVLIYKKGLTTWYYLNEVKSINLIKEFNNNDDMPGPLY
jgi:hypothetical protein